MKIVKIRVKTRPPGQEPAWVREAWIGLELEATKVEETNDFSYMGIMRGIASDKNTGGFLVRPQIAIAALNDARKTEAADWWKTRSLFYKNFIFKEKNCEIITE